MKQLIKPIFRNAKPLLDIIFSPFTLIGSIYFYVLKRMGLKKMRVTRAIFYNIGVFPIIDHYYEPLTNPRHLTKLLSDDRNLPVVDFNVAGQLELLSKFHFNTELSEYHWTLRLP